MNKCIYKLCDRERVSIEIACSAVHYIKHLAIVEGEAFRSNPPLHYENATLASELPDPMFAEWQPVYRWPVYYEDLRRITLTELDLYGVPYQVRPDAARFISLPLQDYDQDIE